MAASASTVADFLASEAAPQMECSVCVEKFNNTKKKSVKCCYCSFMACRTCIKTYLLDKIEYATCMNCNKEWSRKFLVENFEKTFVTKTYKEHREKVLFDREQSFMIATMPIAERLLVLKKDKEEISELSSLIRSLEGKLYRMEQWYRHNEDINNKYYNLEEFEEIRFDRTKRNQLEKANKETQSHFVRKCTFTDCRGFLSTKWKCALCENWTCKECFEVKGQNENEPHVCNPDNLETAKLIRSDTRNCPKCGEGIYKIEGCDQMFCTSCHTPFSWKTGQIVTDGNIHNPHYYEWQRRIGNNERNFGDFECGREITSRNVVLIERELTLIQRETEGRRQYLSPKNISERMRNVIHFRQNYLYRYRADIIQENQDLRIKYLTKEISDIELKFALQKREKKYQFNKEMSSLLNTYVTVSTDIVFRIQTLLREQNTNSKKRDEVNEIMREWDALIEYTNTILEEISNTFNTVKYMFDIQDNGNYVSCKVEKNSKK